MDPISIAIAGGAALVGLLLGIPLGRRGSKPAQRARELEAEVEALLQQSERMQGEKDELESDLEEARRQTAEYKRKVVDHFYGTSEQLRSLTLQYRAVYDHLAEGARELCPEGFTALAGGLDVPPSLDAGSDLEVDPDSDREPARTSEESAS